jgi:hypothetical protein
MEFRRDTIGLLEIYNKKEDWEKLMAAMKKAGLI